MTPVQRLNEIDLWTKIPNHDSIQKQALDGLNHTTWLLEEVRRYRDAMRKIMESTGESYEEDALMRLRVAKSALEGERR